MTPQERLYKWQKIRFMKTLDEIAKELQYVQLAGRGTRFAEPDLQELLDEAVQTENYERAAILRDKINSLSK